MQTLNPLTTSAKSCSDWAEIFSTASFIYLKNIIFYVLIFILHCKKVISNFVFLFLKIYDSAQFKNRF
jgi:hypothetical protein